MHSTVNGVRPADGKLARSAAHFDKKQNSVAPKLFMRTEILRPLRAPTKALTENTHVCVSFIHSGAALRREREHGGNEHTLVHTTCGIILLFLPPFLR